MLERRRQARKERRWERGKEGGREREEQHASPEYHLSTNLLLYFLNLMVTKPQQPRHRAEVV